MAMVPTNSTLITRGRVFISSFAQQLRVSQRAAIEFFLVLITLTVADPTSASLQIGAAICFLGGVFRFWSAGFGYRGGQHLLLGPYRFLRHPYYLGTMLVLIGLAVASRHVVSVLAALGVIVVVFRKRMIEDDKRLSAALGPIYDEYRQRVPALVPMFFGFEPASPAHWTQITANSSQSEQTSRTHFNWHAALLGGRRRELDALVLVLLAFGLMIILVKWWPVDERLWYRIGIGILGFLVVLVRYTYYRGVGRSS